MSNIKYQISNIKKDAGFTLIELLVALIVTITVGSIIISILFSILRGTSKSNAMAIVRQNGNDAISIMAKTLRNAKKLDTPSNCYFPAPTPTPTPVSEIQFTPVDGNQITFTCSGDTIASNGASLLDTNAVALVSGSCSFACSQPGILDSQTIRISFSLGQKTANMFQEKNTVSIPFETSIILRNY